MTSGTKFGLENLSCWANGDENCVIVRSLVLSQYQRVTDRRTNRRTCRLSRFGI